MSKLRIVEPGWQDFSGLYGITEFKNGVSLDDVSELEIMRLGALVTVERIESGAQAGPGNRILETYNNRIDPPLFQDDERALKDNLDVENADMEVEVYTQQELEQIADQKGIAGLRSIADNIGVKGKNIMELMRAILKKQGMTYREPDLSEFGSN